MCSATMETVPMKLNYDQCSGQISNFLPLVPRYEVKAEPQDIKNEPQEEPQAVKPEPQDSSQVEQDVKPGIIRVKTETLENTSGPRVDPCEVKQEYDEDRNETLQVKSEPHDDRRKQQSIECEPLGVEQGASTSGLVIESTSSLSADDTTGHKSYFNVDGVLGTPLQIKCEVVDTAIKEEITEINLQNVQIKNEAVTVESVSITDCFDLVKPVSADSGRPLRTRKRIDYSVFGDSGSDEYVQKRVFGPKKTKDKARFKSVVPKAMCVNPKWKAKNKETVEGLDSTDVGGIANNVKDVNNLETKFKQPSCQEMTRPTGGNIAVSEAEIPGEYPVFWVDVKEENEEEEVEHASDMDNEDTDEEKDRVDDPDWQIDDINDGMDLVRNINKMLSESIKTEVDVLATPTVVRGRRKRRKMEPDELVNELLDGQALSPEQAELLAVLRSRMDFSDPATLSYWDGLKCHMCLVCAYKTHVPAHMVKHVRCHTGEKPYACAECDYRCAESSSLATHMRTHTGEKPYACPHCDYRTNGSSILKTHIMIHTGKKPLSCPHCDFKCREHGGLIRHIRTHTGEKPFACPHCEYRGPSSTCLKSHIMVHTKEKPHVCSYCGYATACSSSLTIHIRRHTGEKPYSCNVCSYKFVTSGTLKVHMRTHTGEKPYLCKICGYRCATQGRFKSHLRIHSGEKKHECPFCDYKSVRSDNLKMHLRTHTGERPYPCPHCEYRSSEKARLVQHIRIHTGEKPYICSICGFRTSDSNGLRSHSRIHSPDKPFCCSYCDFKTARRGILKNHIMRHTGTRPYACPYCPYKCTKSCSLKGHVANNHSGNKKFWCEVKGCNYRAVIASGLKLHLRIHSKSEPLESELCSYREQQENVLKVHVKRCHSSVSTMYACYYCPFNTLSRQRMKSHAFKHLKTLENQLGVGTGPSAQQMTSLKTP